MMRSATLRLPPFCLTSANHSGSRVSTVAVAVALPTKAGSSPTALSPVSRSFRRQTNRKSSSRRSGLLLGAHPDPITAKPARSAYVARGRKVTGVVILAARIQPVSISTQRAESEVCARTALLLGRPP
jgi:hypothetical protein